MWIDADLDGANSCLQISRRRTV